MKSSFLEKSKRALVLLLTGAMIATSVPSNAFAATVADEDVIIEEATDAVAEDAVEETIGMADEVNNSDAITAEMADAAEGINEKDSIDADFTATEREMTITSSTTAINQAFGTAIPNMTHAATGFKGTITDIHYQLFAPKGANTASDIDTAITAAEAGANTKTDIETIKSTKLEAVTSLVTDTGKVSISDTNLSISKTGTTVVISGTPMKLMKDVVWYLDIVDKTLEDDDWATAPDKLVKITVNVTDSTAYNVTASPARLKNWHATVTDLPDATNSAIAFGSGTEDNVTSVTVEQGYTVNPKKDNTTKKENIVPVTVTVSSSLISSNGSIVNAEIVPYDEADASENTTERVKSGNESKNAFTVTPAASSEKVSDGVPANFVVAPATGLTAKAPTGTEYVAKLRLTSSAFSKKEYILYTKVTSDLGLESVKNKDNEDVEASAGIYNLGTFKVGEAISNVAIVTKGGTGSVSITPDYTSNVGGHQYEALPTGLSADTATAGSFKIAGTIATSAYGYLNNGLAKDHYFALTVKDSGTNISNTYVFKYTVAPADVEFSMVKGASDAGRTSLTAGGSTTNNKFNWYGVTTATLSDEYATLYIKNKSDVTLKFKAEFTDIGTANDEFSLDPATAGTSGIDVAKGAEVSIKIVPKTPQSNAIDKKITLTAQGAAPTEIAATYTQNAGLTITKPAVDGKTDSTNSTEGNLPKAKVGEEFSYTFEETHPTSIKGVTWTITSLKVDSNAAVTNSATNVATLKNTYGLTFSNGTLSGVLKAVATADLGTGSGRADGLLLTITATPSPAGTPVNRIVAIETVAPDAGIKFSSDGKEIKNDGTGTLSLGSVDLDKRDSKKATITLTNNTKVEQKTVYAVITAVTDSNNGADPTLSHATGAKNQFKIIYDENDATRDALIYTPSSSVNDTIATGCSGLTLATPNGTGSFVLAVDPANLTAAETYKVEIEVRGASITTQKLYATLTVKDVPVLDISNIGTYAVGTEVAKASHFYSAKYTTAGYTAGGLTDADKFTYELVSGSIPGCTFNSKGYFEGTPTTAGEFELTVRATTNKLAKDVSGELTHKITVAGNSTLTIRPEGVTSGPDSVIVGATYVLPGQITGYEAGDVKKFIVTEGGADDGAKGLAIKVEDAEDDRKDSEDLDSNGIKDIYENTENPYKGSKDYLDVSAIATTIAKNGTTSINVKTKGSAPAGFYKVKITITGENVSPTSFYVAMIVVDKFNITTQTSVKGFVGKALTDSSLQLTAEGGYADQQIVWVEKGTTVSSSSKYFITKTGATDTQATALNMKASADTGLWTLTEADLIGAENNTGLKTSVYGTPALAGKFTVTIGATIAPQNYSAISDGIIATKTMIDRATTVCGKGNNIIPGQIATDSTLTMEIGKSTDPQVTDLMYDPAVRKITASSGKIPGTVVGKSLGNGYSSISTYTYKAVAEGYDEANEKLTVILTGGDAGNLLKAKAKLSSGKKMTLDASSTGAIDPANEAAIGAGGVTWVIKPKANLDPGSYEDTLLITGTSIADVSIKVTFVVAEATYAATIDNNIAPDEKDAAKLAKRVAYVTDTKDGEATNEIALDAVVAGGATGTPKVITVRNTGNSVLKGVKVTEVRKSGSKFVTGGALLTIANGTETPSATVKNIDVAGGSVDIPLDAVGYFKVTNQITTKSGETPYIEVSYKDEAGTAHNIYIPVAVTVLNANVETITATPGENNSSEVAMTSLNETYDPKDGELVFTLANTATARTETLKNANASMNKDTGDYFDIMPIDPDADDIEPGKSITIKVRPKSGLKAGTYVDTIQFTGSNIKSNLTRKIKFVVTESDAFTANKVTTTGITISDSAIATKLYNSIWYGLQNGAATPLNDYVVSATYTTGSHTFGLNLDKNTTGNKDDVQIVFTGIDATTKLSAVSSAAITITANNTVATATKTVALSDTEVTYAKEHGIGYVANPKTYAKTFKELTFNLYNIVTFAANPMDTDEPDVVKLYDDVKDLFEKDDFKLYTALAAGSTPTYNQLIDSKANATKDKVGKVEVLIPMGATAGSVFGGTLPTYTAARREAQGWKDGANADVLSTTAIKKDTNCTIKSTAYTYAADGKKDGDPGVTWTWTNDNGNINAVLTLTDTTGKFDETSKIEVTKDSATNGTTFPHVSQAVDIKDNGSQVATCTKGSRKELKATAKVKINDDSDEREYSGTYSLDEQDDALGHTWLNPVITWTDANADGKYTKDEVKVTKTCSVCSEKIELTVTDVKETMSVEPTCTKDGKATYAVIYTDVDKFSKPTSSVTDSTNVKESVVKALGHKYKLEVEWATDHKSATKATLVCSVCDDKEPGHTVDVTTSVTYDPKVDKDSGDLISNQAIYHAGEKDEVKSEEWLNHEHNWSDPVWAWSPDNDEAPTSATATFTCTTGGEVKVVAATITNEKDGDKYIDYTAKVTFEGKDYTDVITIDAETGKRTAKHEHVWKTDKKWTWDPATGVPTSASLTFTCSVGTKPETKTVSGTAVAGTPSAKGVVEYTVEITGPDGKPYKTSKKVDKDGKDITGQDISGGAGIEIQDLEDEYPFTGKPVTPSFRVYDSERGAYLAFKADYTVKYANNKAAGKATVTVTGKGNYTGTSASAEFTIVDPTADLDKDSMAEKVVKVTLPKATYTYTGAPQYPASVTVKVQNGKTKSDITFTHDGDGEYSAPADSQLVGISVTNNINAGKATVAAVGKDGVAKSTTFAIGKADIAGAKFEAADSVWGQKAIETEVTGTFGDDEIELIGNGGDFKATFKAPAAGSGTATIKGANNFKGSTTVSYNVAAFEITEDDIVVTAFTGNKAKAVKVQVLDKAGNVVNKKLYTYEIQDSEGKALDAKAAVPAEIAVVVKATGANVKTDEDGVSKDVKVGANLAKVKVTVTKGFAKIYTGEAINLEEEDFGTGKIVVPGDFEYGTDYIVAGYQNNIKKGTMKVTLQGTSEKLSGTKVIKVTIAPKPIKSST